MSHTLHHSDRQPTTTRTKPADQASFLAQPQASHYPRSWYLLCSEAELRRGPLKKELLGKELVVFRTESGRVGVLENRCVHMGSELSNGCVVGESIQCSLHHWRFGTEGLCQQIPTSEEIPPFARQSSYPVEVRHGQVYFFNGREALFPLPFFESVEPKELIAAAAFEEEIDCSWYMVGANAVDVQHFSIAHDRRLLEQPAVDHPSPYVHRTLLHFAVEGNSLGDRLTRRFGGPTVTLQINDWSSTMLFAHSTLDHAETFGMLCMVPIDPRRTRVHITIMARRSEQKWQRLLIDPLRARIRRALIRKFLRSDVQRIGSTVYSPHTLIEIDRQFDEYFQWLGGLM